MGLWRDSLHVTCGLTACTPGSAPGPTLGNEYGKTLPFYDDIYGAVIIAQNYCDTSRGSFDECRLSAGWSLNPQTKPTDLGCESAARLLRPHPPSPFYYYSAYKADTHFTVPQRVER